MKVDDGGALEEWDEVGTSRRGGGRGNLAAMIVEVRKTRRRSGLMVDLEGLYSHQSRLLLEPYLDYPLHVS